MKGTLDSLHSAVLKLNVASHDELRSELWITSLLREVGLTKDDVRNQGNEQWQIEDSELGGINQTPEQYSPALIELSKQEIRTITDVGTWSGWNIAFLLAYLRRFEPSCSAVSIDRSPHRSAELRADPFFAALNVQFHFYNSVSQPVPRGILRDADLAFIDAGHAYSNAHEDWLRYGQGRCVFFHDVNDEPIYQAVTSCKHLWDEIKKNPPAGKRTIDLFQHPSGKPLMGIGLILPA